MSHKTKTENLQSKCSDKFDEFFLSLLFFFFSHTFFLEWTSYCILICFCFYLLITLQMRIYLQFSLSFIILFFWYISFAFSGLFLLLSLISAFSEWNFFLVILQEQEHAPAVHRSLSLPVPFSHSLCRSLFLAPTNGCLPGCLVVVSITVRSVRTCTYTHTYTSQTWLDIDTDVKNTADFYTPNAGICHCLHSLAHCF